MKKDKRLKINIEKIKKICFQKNIDVCNFLWDLQLNKKLITRSDYFINKEAKRFFMTLYPEYKKMAV